MVLTAAIHELEPCDEPMHRALRRSALLLTFGLAGCHGTATPPARPAADAEAARIARVESGLLRVNVVRSEPSRMELRQRMDDYNVPAVSVAVFDSTGILWARAWGEAAPGVPADTATLFQAASISKPVAAAGALRLVERGVLDLDGDVNARLESWRVPEGAQTADARVTLRRLLSHTAGTTVHGFPGYAAGAPLPTAVQVLEGAGPANTDPVVVDTLPGSGFRYSGGGYTIAQQLMVDVTDRPFPELMRELVLEPAGMRHSTYAQPLPAALATRAAVAHGPRGEPIAGRWHAYPEMAAAGLWTTPSDLARFALAITRAYRGEATTGLLAPATVRTMTTAVDAEAGYGLGFGLEATADGDLWIVHGGSNEGFEAYFATLAGGRGAVIMTNGANGHPLAMEVMRAIAAEYDLPGFRPNLRDAIAVEPARLAAIAGEYHATLDDGPEVSLTLDVIDGHLAATVPIVRFFEMPLRASAPDTFFFLGAGGELTVERDAAGAVEAVVVSGFGDPLRLERR